jgi:hypothetical protein
MAFTACGKNADAPLIWEGQDFQTLQKGKVSYHVTVSYQATPSGVASLPTNDRAFRR